MLVSIQAQSDILEQFDRDGYVVVKGLLDPVDDFEPVIDEYSNLLDKLAKQWFEEGKISSLYSHLPFLERMTQIFIDTEGKCHRHFDISLPQSNITTDTPMHFGPNIFNLLRNPKLLDVVEKFIGPEIYSNPVQHTRIKPPENSLTQSLRSVATIGSTYWHQDQGVITENADESNILTVWFPITEATTENGCLVVVPESHKRGLVRHCFSDAFTGITKKAIDSNQVPLPMKPGDVLFMTRLTQHSSLPNVSNQIRWSFDLRYNPIGQATGREVFPGFIARSKSNPESEMIDPNSWLKSWEHARLTLAIDGSPDFNRWDPNDPTCA